MGNADAKVGSGGWRNVFKNENGKWDGSEASGNNGCWVGDGGAARRAGERRGGDGRGVRACDGAETWRREQK